MQNQDRKACTFMHKVRTLRMSEDLPTVFRLSRTPSRVLTFVSLVYGYESSELLEMVCGSLTTHSSIFALNRREESSCRIDMYQVLLIYDAKQPQFHFEDGLRTQIRQIVGSSIEATFLQVRLLWHERRFRFFQLSGGRK